MSYPGISGYDIILYLLRVLAAVHCSNTNSKFHGTLPHHLGKVTDCFTVGGRSRVVAVVIYLVIPESGDCEKFLRVM